MHKKLALITLLGFYCAAVSNFALAGHVDVGKMNTLKLPEYVFIKGSFAQERSLKGIVRPIKSSGIFAIWKDNGIYWETSQPLFQATSYTPEGAYYWLDKTSARLATENLVGLNERITQLMLAFFTVDFDQLEKGFQINQRIEQEGWSIELLPSSSSTERAVKKVFISGGEYVESISIDLASGDQIRIWLTVEAEEETPDLLSKDKIRPDLKVR